MMTSTIRNTFNPRLEGLSAGTAHRRLGGGAGAVACSPLAIPETIRLISYGARVKVESQLTLYSFHPFILSS